MIQRCKGFWHSPEWYSRGHHGKMPVFLVPSVQIFGVIVVGKAIDFVAFCFAESSAVRSIVVPPAGGDGMRSTLESHSRVRGTCTITERQRIRRDHSHCSSRRMNGIAAALATWFSTVYAQQPVTSCTQSYLQSFLSAPPRRRSSPEKLYRAIAKVFNQ